MSDTHRLLLMLRDALSIDDPPFFLHIIVMHLGAK